MASRNVLDSSYYVLEYMNEYKSKKTKVMLETLTYMYETFTKFSVTIEHY